jgi:hypothetical protein
MKEVSIIGVDLAKQVFHWPSKSFNCMVRQPRVKVSATASPYAARLDGWLKRHGMKSSMPLRG